MLFKRFWFNYGDWITDRAKGALPYLGGGVVVAALLYLAIMFYVSSTTLTIEGRIFHPKSEQVSLMRFQGDERVVVATAIVDGEGRFSFRVDDADDAPMLYEIECSEELIPVVGAVGEKIKVEAVNPISTNYWVSGSVESKMLQEHYQQFMTKVERLEFIAANYAATTAAGGRGSQRVMSKGSGASSNMSQSTLELEYNTTYSEIKQLQRRFITQNKGQMSAIYALFLRVPGEEFLFSEEHDTTYMNMVRGSIEQRYPKAEYLRYLEAMLEREKERIEQERMRELEQIGSRKR
ncbi:MAG: hypothetical protein SNH79_06455 [Rikenellaceae bacterium]